jgi:hypothetical protein
VGRHAVAGAVRRKQARVGRWRMIPKSTSSTPIGDGSRFLEKIMRKENVSGRRDST